MLVTITTPADPCAFAKFTWSDDMQDCDLVSFGFSDETLDRLIEAKAHEGADLNGFVVTIS